MTAYDAVSDESCFGSVDDPLKLPVSDDMRDLADRYCFSRGFDHAVSYDEKDSLVVFICCTK